MEILLRIIGMVLRHKWRLAGAYLCMAGATLAYLVLPRLFGAAVDEVAVVLEGGAVSEPAVLAIVISILAFSAGPGHPLLRPDIPGRGARTDRRLPTSATGSTATYRASASPSTTASTPET